MTPSQWAHFSEWEDWKAGMYSPTLDPERVAQCAGLLGNPGSLSAAMLSVVESWQTSTTLRLSAMQAGRRSWLGQAACCYMLGATRRETCAAWAGLSMLSQIHANMCADKTISAWEGRVAYGETLFG